MQFMLNKDQIPKLISGLLIASAIALPFNLSIAIICWGVIAFFRIIIPEERRTIFFKFKTEKLLIWLPALYLLHIVALLWTENFKYAGLDLQIKMTMLLLPVFIGTLSKPKLILDKVMAGFVAGNVLSLIYLLSIATIHYTHNSDVLQFFYGELCSPLMHPTYLGMYVNFSILCVLYFLRVSTPGATTIYLSVLLFFLFVMETLISARTAQICTLVTVIIYFIYLLKTNSFTQQKTTILSAVLILTLFTYFGLSRLNNRYAQVEQAIEQNNSTSTQRFNSTTGRLEIWKESVELIKTNWLFGTGTGDVKDELVKLYHAHNFNYGYEKALNSHNEFLQIWIALGLIGLIIFIGVFLHPILNYANYESLLFPLFLLIIGLNALTESILEVQRGVLFFTFFYSLILLNGRKDKSSQ